MNFTFCYVKAGNCTYWQDLLVHAALTISPNTTTAGRNIPFARLPHSALSKSIGIKASLSVSLASHPCSDRHGYIPSVDSG